MNKLIPLLAFSIFLLVPVSQNAFAIHTLGGTGLTGHCLDPPGPGVDYSNCAITSSLAGFDLTGADFSGADLNSNSLSGSILAGANFDSSVNVDFSGVLDLHCFNAPGCIPDDGDPVHSNADCNDNDPTIFPGAFEIPGDNVDQNCNGSDGLLSCGGGTTLSGNQCIPDSSQQPIICGPGTVEVNGVCECEEQNTQCIGGRYPRY